jgi:DNA-binding response OmpR family regulator
VSETVERRPAQYVLVVDDDASIRLLCRINLELEGWTVREAATIDGARGELARSPVDVVLLDVHVGRESGLDFLEEVRAQHPAVPVVLLTGSIGTDKLRGVAADAVIAKPFTLGELTGTVRRLASRVAEPSG